MAGKTASLGDANTLIDRLLWLHEEVAVELQGKVDFTPPPSFSFYQDRWLSDGVVALMDSAAEGNHIRLMCYAWQGMGGAPPCSLPTDEDQIRAWCKWPTDEEWIPRRRVIFGDPEAEPPLIRAWRLRDGRWWQLGLIRSYLDLMHRRVKMTRAAAKRWATEGRQEHVELYARLGEVLEQLQANGESPQMDLPTSAVKQEDSPPATIVPVISSVEGVWSAFVRSRAAAYESLNKKATTVALTDGRRKRITALLRDYSGEELMKAWAGIRFSDWHCGRRDGTLRLNFEALSAVNSKINQIEVLMGLWDNPPDPAIFDEKRTKRGHEIE